MFIRTSGIWHKAKIGPVSYLTPCGFSCCPAKKDIQDAEPDECLCPRCFPDEASCFPEEKRDDNGKPRLFVKAKDLQLADVVRRGRSGPYNCCTVKKVTEDSVVLFRPYTQTADFSYTGGVICYIGIEEYAIYRNDELYEVLERKELN